MKCTGKVKTVLAGCILIAASIIAFTGANALLNNGPALADDGKPFVSVASIEEASRLAGYQVSTPTFLPQGFENTPKITVHDTNPKVPKRVMQVWNADRDVFFLFIQDPSLDGIGGGKGAEVCGVPGESKFSEATSGRPAILSLYWRSGDMAYVITGTLKGTLDEETLQKVASSVVTK